MKVNEALKRIKQAETEEQLEELRIEYLGRKGSVTQKLREVGSMPPGQRAEAGKQANAAKQQIEDAITEREEELRHAKLEREAEKVDFDVTAPAPVEYGHLHPVNSLLRDVIRLFWQMGYEVASGPEIENQWYCFEALNIPADHPARDMQDTFYLENGTLPRTHTSSVQVRYMEDNQPPIRIIAPGKVYRNEDEDARHAWMFYQVEGLVVGEGVSVADLKGTLLTLVKGILGEEAEIRLRPNYFPYTEPSIEVDASCVLCNKQGCKMCSGTGWVELLGSGMVHPRVLKNVGIDPERYSGFAFGVGLERLAVVKYGIADLREFWRPNIKFLEQF